MTLREARNRFARMLPRLLDKAHELGFEVAGDEWMRGRVQAEVNALTRDEKRELAALIRERFPRIAAEVVKAGKGKRTSLHCDGLAVDLNLYLNGEWLSTTEAHKALGEWWESQGGAWGGRWGDGNHYSIAYGGRK